MPIFHPGRLSRFGKALLLIHLFAGLAFLPAASPAGETSTPSRLQAQRLDGNPYSLADSRGTVTLVALWSPDSLASRKCIWELQRFTTLFGGRGVTVVAVSTSADADRLRRFAAERQLDLPIAILGDNDFGPMPEQALPIVHVFDREGRLRSSRRGLFRLRDLESMVEPLL